MDHRRTELCDFATSQLRLQHDLYCNYCISNACTLRTHARAYTYRRIPGLSRDKKLINTGAQHARFRRLEWLELRCHGLRKILRIERRHRSGESKLTEESLRIDVSLLDWSKAFAVGRKIPSRNFVRFEKKMSNTNQRLSFNPVSLKSWNLYDPPTAVLSVEGISSAGFF